MLQHEKNVCDPYIQTPLLAFIAESSMCTQWVANDPRFYADSEDSDQIGRI